MKLRLLVTKDCDRSCKGCCNKNWDLDGLETVQSFKGYDEVLLTGGEPMLDRDRLLRVIDRIKQENPDAKIYMYTAMVKKPVALTSILLHYLDGITLTLHEKSDVKDFMRFDTLLSTCLTSAKSLRLNVFKGINVNEEHLRCAWIVKSGMKWIKDCPLPKDEVFMKI
jgi:molybdenum cofactor biosynthesis enzyme MoaA